jgi:hypothetical protein
MQVILFLLLLVQVVMVVEAPAQLRLDLQEPLIRVVAVEVAVVDMAVLHLASAEQVVLV